MKATTHNLTPHQKESIFNQHYQLIYMIYKLGNAMMLREQIRQLYSILYLEQPMNTDMAIAELINHGFLLQKRVCKDSRTEMLYLSKYPISRIIDKKSRDVPAIAFSNQKLFENIFQTEYLITNVIPQMQIQGFKIEVDNILTYLRWIGSNLLLKPNQINIHNYYELFESVAGQYFKLSDTFYSDMNIALSEQELFKKNRLKIDTLNDIPYLREKCARDNIRKSYKSDIQRNKLYYNFANFMGRRFNIAGIYNDAIYIAYFDSLNSLTLDKLYKHAIYSLLLFQRYINLHIVLHITVYTWSEARCLELQRMEQKNSFDINKQEFKETNKRDTYFSNLGIKRQFWDDIEVNYRTLDIANKYYIHS